MLPYAVLAAVNRMLLELERGQHLAACLSFAVLVATAQHLPSSANFLHTQCDGHRRIYQPLIDNQLAAYRDGLLVNDILRLDGPSDPIALLYNNSLMARQLPALNMAAIWVPLVRELATRVRLPDLVLAGNTWDMPEDDTFKGGGPWWGFCNIMFMSTNLLLPSGPGLLAHRRCGRNCWPFTDSDHRLPKAIFLGSTTGWLVGRRNAVVLAGMLHNETVYSGYTQVIDLPHSILSEGRPALTNLKPRMNLTEQVNKYKYVINADGHCATTRMHDLLASESAVLWVETNQIEWFYPLLQPYVHYIPVRFLEYEPQDPLRDIVKKVAWAEMHPEKVATIVKNANRFAITHLSDHALTCYSVQILHEYAGLFQDPQQLQAVAAAGKFSVAYTNYTR